MHDEWIMLSADNCCCTLHDLLRTCL